ncbi:MAG TPA: hypothetical protein VIF34_08235 [Methylocystis sp.]|jgi:hypothetical protein
MKKLAFMIALFASTVAWAQEEPVADTEAAIRDGFKILPEPGDQKGTRERQSVLEEFVTPLGKSVGAKPPYEFSFVLLKGITDNGLSTLFLRPRIPSYDPDHSTAGGPLLVYTFETGGKWTRQIAAGAFNFALRKHGSSQDIALIREHSYRLFRWDGKRFVEMKHKASR